MKITPNIKEKNQVKFSTLEDGQVFLWHGGIWIKEEGDDQACVNLKTGVCYINNCEEYVVPVDATLTWKHVTPKKKK